MYRQPSTACVLDFKTLEVMVPYIELHWTEYKTAFEFDKINIIKTGLTSFLETNLELFLLNQTIWLL
jgi:hypothetical protein